MKITIQRDALLGVLQTISGVVEKRQTLPILANILLRVKDQQLALTATDLEIEMIGSVPLEQMEEEGLITVSARKLLDIVRALPEGSLIDMVLQDNNLLLRSGKSRFVLTTLPARDFPSIEEAVFQSQFTINQSKLKKLIAKIYFAMGQQDVRHYLNGTLVDINQGVMRCVATDGHRLAMSSINDNNLDGIRSKVIVPRKSILELMRLLDSSDEATIAIHIGDNHFRVTANNFIFTSKLINAQYPDYEKLIPRSTEHTVTASREGLKQALSRASILSNEKFRGIRLHLNPDLLKIVANNPEQEEAEEQIQLDYQGNSMEMGFNVSYLLDVVSTIASEMIRWSFTDPSKGIVIEPSEEHDDDTKYVVMPMKL